MSFTPSPYQQAIWDFIQYGEGNAVIEAVAGSGKTTTIVKGLEFISDDLKPMTQFVAFNNSIVNELTERVPELVKKPTTFHSFGLNVIRANYPNRFIKVNKNKVIDFLKKKCPTWNECREMENKEQYAYMYRIKELVDKSKMNMCESLQEICEIADHHDIDVIHMECERALEAINVTSNNHYVVDFADMIYIPAKFEMKVATHAFVFVDECQDLNKAQQELLMKMVDPIHGRFIAVGDPSQAIYGFAGADVESYNKLKAMPDTITLPLSVSYRCGKEIIKEAQNIVSHIEAFDGAIDGEVDRESKLEDVCAGDMILCRNKAPLIELTLEFLANGTKAYMMGKHDIGNMLKNFVKKMRAKTFVELNQKMDQHVEKYVKKKVAETDLTDQQVRRTAGYAGILDKIACVKAISKDDSVENPYDILNAIDRIFDESVEGIVLSTIHKSKGLEADNVYALKYELLPSKYATQEWQMEQERNLEYVMITRAKKKFGYLTQSRLGNFEEDDMEDIHGPSTVGGYTS